MSDRAAEMVGAARHAIRLEVATLAWDAIEAALAIGAGVAAGSVVLVAFGLDSAVEIVAATVVLAHLRALVRGREPDAERERRALRVIAVTFFAVAAYVTADVVLALARREQPQLSPLGITVASLSLVVMLVLAWAKRRAATALASTGWTGPAALLRADAAETALCATMSAATLVGLAGDGLLGWWWADPVASLVIVYFAVREGREAWEGDLDADD